MTMRRLPEDAALADSALVNAPPHHRVPPSPGSAIPQPREARAKNRGNDHAEARGVRQAVRKKERMYCSPENTEAAAEM